MSTRRKILCAEAQEDIGALIALMLGKKGYEVRTVHTVADALRAAAAERFDLYVLNDTYIDGDSFDLMRQLRQLTPAIPVLMFSLEGSAGQRASGVQQHGVSYYVSKTSDFTALVETIDNVFRAR
ncbi:MAG: response regulator [Pyrinomonadaceae bacterium]